MSTVFLKKFFGLGIICVSLLACTMQKRIHRPGYFVKWNLKSENKSVEESKKSHIDNDIKELQVNDFSKIDPIEDNEIFANVSNSTPNKISAFYINSFENGCDTIFFRDGRKFEVKIKGITNNEVSYSACNSGSNVYSVSTNKIEKIRFDGGREETFDVANIQITPKTKVKKSTPTRYISPNLGISSLFTTLGGWIIMSIAVIFEIGVFAVVGALILLLALILAIRSFRDKGRNRKFGLISIFTLILFPFFAIGIVAMIFL